MIKQSVEIPAAFLCVGIEIKNTVLFCQKLPKEQDKVKVFCEVNNKASFLILSVLE